MKQSPIEGGVNPATRVIPGARAALGLLIFINLFNYIDRQVLAAVVGPIKDTFFGPGSNGGGPGVQALLEWCRTHLGFKPENALIGVLSMAFMVAYMLGAPIFGRLAERRSRWGLVAIGVILWSLASGASGLAGTFVLLLLTRCFVGIGEAAYGPVAPTMISDYYPVEWRGRMLAWFYMAIPVGSALGFVVGAAIKDSSIGATMHGLLGTAPESWRWAFYLVMIPGLVLGTWCFFMREPPRGQSDLGHATAARAVAWKDYLVLLRTPSFVYCSLGMTAMTFALGGIAFWMPYYLETVRGIGGNPVIVFGGIVVVSGLSGTMLGGILGDRLKRRFPGSYFLVSGVAMLAGFPLFLAVLKAPVPWIWICVFLACFCLFFNTGPTNTILANVSHPAMRAPAFALNIFVIHAFGDVISPVIIGILSDRFQDMNKAFLLVAVMFLVGGVFWLWGARHLERDTQLAPTRLPE